MLDKHQISFFLLVTLVDPQELEEIAKGTVVVRPKVHGFPVTDDEVAISISKVFRSDEINHPQYGYELSAGGFTA